MHTRLAFGFVLALAPVAASAAPSPAPTATAVPPWQPDPAPTIDPAAIATWQAKVLVGRLLEGHCAAHGGLLNGFASIGLPSIQKPYPATLDCRDGKTVRVEAPEKSPP